MSAYPSYGGKYPSAITTRVSLETRDDVREMAAAEGVSLHEWIRRAIAERIEKREVVTILDAGGWGNGPVRVLTGLEADGIVSLDERSEQVNFAVLHAEYGAYETMNCPAEMRKNKDLRNEWRRNNPFLFAGTRWVPRYRPFLSNTAKTIRDWHIAYHGDDGRQIDNDPYRNARNRIPTYGELARRQEVMR